VDLLVHGGDVFHKPTAPASLVYQAFDPLKEVADAGIPVFLVPGNHERSRIPFDWLARHPGVHVFREAKTETLEIEGTRIAITGLPCIRRDVRTRFPTALAETRWRDEQATVRLLVTHQAFEGAVVGVQNFMFRRGDDVVRLSDLPADFAAVLSGHIHRSQVLDADLHGRSTDVPVFYPGSIERTAFAERLEPKGFMTLEVAPGPKGGTVSDWTFHDLGARPMEIRPLEVRGRSAAAVERALREVLSAVPQDAVLRLEADGPPAPEARAVVSAERLRSAAPQTMNVELVVLGDRRWSGRRGGSSRSARQTAAPGSATPDRSDQQDLF